MKTRWSLLLMPTLAVWPPSASATRRLLKEFVRDTV